MVADVITCQFQNELDQKHFTLYTEWDDLCFKIMLLRPEKAPLSGKMTTKDINYFSEELSKSNDEYLQETKNAFRGEDSEIQFYLYDETFEWKRKNVWTLGKISMSPILDIKIISETFEWFLRYHQNTQKRLLCLEKDNEFLNDMKVRLCNNIEEMIKMKTSMEGQLYRKFLLIHNAKKKRIRELEDTLKHVKKEPMNKKNTIFDMPTDQSEESDDAKDRLHNTTKDVKPEKQKLKYRRNNGNATKTRKTRSTISRNINIQENQSPKASTSKDTLGDTSKVFTLSSEETECEIELQDTGSSDTTEASTSRINCVEEVSEEELFSQ